MRAINSLWIIQEEPVPIVDVFAGEITKAQIFVCVLGASGYTFVHASSSQNTEDFIDAHVKAFHFYGGVPNMHSPVLKLILP